MTIRLITLACLAATYAAKAEIYRPKQLTPSEWIDTEASTNFPCSFNLDGIKDYTLAIELVATPSNNVVVAIGADADHDGALAFDETALEVGWDCGAAFARSAHDALVPSVSATDTNGVVTLSLKVEIHRKKSNPLWLYDRAWNLLRITTRGVGNPSERISLRMTKSGFALIFR